MRRRIVGYHKDELDDWVAELDCLHGQHVRHKPPFFNRPWVESEEGRASMLGYPLNCVRCDALEFPEGLSEYKRTPLFTRDTVPAGLLRDHSTKAGVWGRIRVLEGTLRYTVQEPEERVFELTAGDEAVVAPEMKHHVSLAEDTCFLVAFFKKA